MKNLDPFCLSLTWCAQMPGWRTCISPFSTWASSLAALLLGTLLTGEASNNFLFLYLLIHLPENTNPAIILNVCSCISFQAVSEWTPHFSELIGLIWPNDNACSPSVLLQAPRRALPATIPSIDAIGAPDISPVAFPEHPKSAS